MTVRYLYESDWRQYEYPKQQTEFSYLDDIVAERNIPRVNLNSTLEKDVAGLPIWSDGVSAYMNGDTEMSIIFGGTGSKKTRTLVAPLICNLAKAKESMVIVDVKGELSVGSLAPYIRSTLKKQGYNEVFLDFRQFNGDGYNLLGKACKKAKEKNLAEANKLIKELATLLCDNYKDEKSPSWALDAANYMVNMIMLMLKYLPEKYINMSTLSALSDPSKVDELESLFNEITVSDDEHINNIRGVLNLASGHKTSIMGVLSGALGIFNSDPKFSKMVSVDTFAISDLYDPDKPAALFLIVPDEQKTYDTIVGVILSEIVNDLISAAYLAEDEKQHKTGKLSRRVNFICDEFCNYRMPNMERYISAHRSRNIRWYLVCQGVTQLTDCYKNEVGTILGNCVNQYFLSTPDIACLNYIVDHSGTVNDNPDYRPEPLVSLAQLSGMKKGDYTECFLSMRGKQLVVELPDIMLYGNDPQKPYYSAEPDKNWQFPCKLAKSSAGASKLPQKEFAVPTINDLQEIFRSQGLISSPYDPF